MRRGKVSYSKMRAVTRVATPETEADLLNVATSGTAAHVKKIVRAWRRVDRQAEQAEDRRRHETRSLRTWVDEDGMVVIRGRLSPARWAVVRRALEAACDQARGADAPAAVSDEGAAPGAGAEAPSLAQRQADALGVIAKCALSGGLDRGDGGRSVSGGGACGRGPLTEAPDVHEASHVPAGTSETAALGPAPRDSGHPSEGSPAAASTSEPGDRRPHASEETIAAASGSQGHGDRFRVPAGTPETASLVPVRHGAGQETHAGAVQDGVSIDPDTLTPDWRGERLDLEWVIHQLWRPRPQAEATCKRQAADQS